MKEGWEYKKLEDVCLQITDGSHSSPKEALDGIYPMLSVKDMLKDGFNYSMCKYINEADYLSLKKNGCMPLPNDVLVAKDGSYLKTAFVQCEEKEQAILSSIAILRPKQDIILSHFIAHFFKAGCTKKTIEKNYLSGTAIKRVILKGFKKIQIPLPPLSEQQSIVAELDKINEIIDLKKAQLKDLDLLAQSIFYDMFGDPIENPKGWETKTLGEISKFRRGSFPQPYGESKWYGGEESMPFVQVADLQDEGFDLVEVTKKQISKEAQPMSVFVPKGTVLVSLQGTIGKVAITQYDCYVDRTVAIFYEINDLYYTQFFFAFELKYLFEEKRKKARGISIKTITKEEFTAFDCLLPPLSLQQSFASKIQAIESQKSAIKQSLAEVETLLASRMDYYFN